MAFNRHKKNFSEKADKERARKAAKLTRARFIRRTFPQDVKLTYLRVMMTPEEKGRLRMNAAANGFPSMSEYVRALLNADTIIMQAEQKANEAARLISEAKEKARTITLRSSLGGSSDEAARPLRGPGGTSGTSGQDTKTNNKRTP